jgi:hypothetical protein
MKTLKDGETRKINASREFSMFKHKRFEVTAHRVDCDTPFVILKLKADPYAVYSGNPPEDREIHLTDVEAYDLIDRLQRALGILPSSK